MPNPVINLMGFFYVQNLARIADMCELSNAEIFNRWKQCKTSNRLQAADYWYEFMTVRAKYGDKIAQGVIKTMDSLK